MHATAWQWSFSANSGMTRHVTTFGTLASSSLNHTAGFPCVSIPHCLFFSHTRNKVLDNGDRLYIYISFSKIGGAVSVPFLLQAAFHVINCTSCDLVVFHPSALSQARLLKSSRWLLPLSFQPPVCSSSWVLGSQLVANSLQQGYASGYADLYICQSDYDPTICSLLREYSRP